jgi:hypothetical protein
MIMFAEHAHRLFEIIGKECTARGVFIKEQLPEAIQKLHQAIDEEKLAAKLRANEEHDTKDDDEETEEIVEEDDSQSVSLGHRAVPLIHLMEWTLKEGGFILWEADRDF